MDGEISNVLIEKVSNGFIVYENYDKSPIGATSASYSVKKVFESNKALNEYLNENMKL